MVFLKMQLHGVGCDVDELEDEENAADEEDGSNMKLIVYYIKNNKKQFQ